jgi:hypothetical protein
LTTELQIFLWAAGILLAVNFIAVLLHFLYRALSNGPLRDRIREVVYLIDELADDMSNEQKKRKAIQEISEVFGWWRKIFLPNALIGWVIDLQVTMIRRMQKAAGTPNLHVEEDDHEKGNSNGTPGTRFTGQE